MNANKLKGKIVENGKNIPMVADEIGIDKVTFYRKLANLEKFTVGEALRIKNVLLLSNDDALDIFLS